MNAEISGAALCDPYLTEGLITRRPSSIASARSDIEHHIKPIFGIPRDPDIYDAFDEASIVHSVRGAHDLAYRDARSSVEIRAASICRSGRTARS